MPLAAPTLASVALGGALGSVLRWLVELVLPQAQGGVPWATLLVNVVGSALLGAVVVVLDSGVGSGLHRGFLATGVLGGFTTFSTFAVQVGLGLEVAPAVVLLYLLLTPALCVGAAALAAGWTRRAWVSGRARP
ncbi:MULTISPECIES: FluC/FEX family fluoride channel [unclassified Ornithinimicrobium]|uniref:FluC/FEX family fluoride channel n=1 Tax=unclassified Ornithinimicrobium TaxID=2615080 RepID=UPI0038551351